MSATPVPGKPGDLRVSVVIPLYNHERYIEAAIHSVLAQTVPPAEIIVIDDGSSDGSAEKVRELCKAHPQIIFWSWPNQGAHHTLNAGILRATGDFVAILNSDDCYEPQRLAACLSVVQSNPSVDVVASMVTFIDEQGSSVSNAWYDDALSFYKQKDDIAIALFHANFLVTTSNLFVRRSVFETIGTFAPLRYTHDLEFILRLVLGKRRIHFLDQPQLAYRLHRKNTISESKVRQDIERAAVFAFFLYRQWLGEGANGSVHAGLARYVEVLHEQDVLEIVEDFLNLLAEKPQPEAMAVTGSLPGEFRSFLARLGLDWIGQADTDLMLTRFKTARKVFMRRRGDAKEVTGLKAEIQWSIDQRSAWEKTASEQKTQIKALTQGLEELRVGNAWLLEQRNAWEQTARNQEELAKRGLEELRAGNAWLLEQRDAWEQAARAQGEQAQSLAQGLAELRTGNAWLLEQRDAWERAAHAQGEQVQSLAQGLAELRTGNAWLLEQRDAWERAAARSAEELAQCQAALDGLLSHWLVRLLVRMKLLKPTHVATAATAPR